MSKLGWTEIVRTIFEIVSGLAALIFIYQFFQSAAQPDRQRVLLLLALAAVVLFLVLLGRRLLKRAIVIARIAARFGQQNALLVTSLVLALALLYVLLQRTQDTTLAAATVGLVVAVTGIAVGAVRLLAMTRPSFLGLRVQAAEIREAPAVPKGLWSHDFIEHFNDPTTRRSAEQPDHIQVMQKAQSVGVVRPAIFEHPRAHGQTVLTYIVEEIPEHVREVELEFFTGILDRVHNKTTGLTEVSKFHTTPGNKIGFAIQVNEEPVFWEMRDRVGWSSLQQVGGLSPFSGALEVSFRTDAKGNPHWNWAAWGEPRLVEAKPTSSAAG